MFYCENCKTEYPAGKKFCRSCGSPLKERAADSSMRCVQCGTEAAPGKKFCRNCGAPLSVTQAMELSAPPACPNCGKEITPGKKFCRYCGHSLDAGEGMALPTLRKVEMVAPTRVSEPVTPPAAMAPVRATSAGTFAAAAAPAPEPEPRMEARTGGERALTGQPAEGRLPEAIPALVDGQQPILRQQASESATAEAVAKPATSRHASVLEGSRILGTIEEPTVGAASTNTAADTSDLLGGTVSSTATGRWPYIVGGASAAILLCAALTWYFFFSTEARMIRAVNTGDLVSPAGKSAYDYYKRLGPQGISGGTRTELLQKALPKLTAAGESLLQKRVEAVNFKESELAELGLVYQWAAELSPGDTKIAARNHYAEGIAALIGGKPREALQHFQRSTEYDGNWAPALNDLGRTYVKLGDSLHAEQSYRRAIEIDPNWVYPQLNLAGVYFLRKDLGPAEQAYIRATQLDGTLATPWYFLGQLYEGEKRYADGVVAYERAVQLAASRPSSAFRVDAVQRRIEKL